MEAAADGKWSGGGRCRRLNREEADIAKWRRIMENGELRVSFLHFSGSFQGGGR